MKRVIIIGCPGSGKSTFARKLAEKTDLPLYYLDMLKWNSDKTTVSKNVFMSRLESVLSKELWIIDGNYLSTMELRLKYCDTVFILDYETSVCLSGISERKGKSRPDMPWIETEDDEEFLDFVRNYNTQVRPRVLDLLDKYCNKNIIIFKKRSEADSFLENMR
ncbi:MAG: adenylate kinase [Ruminococcaceae bacterium]|nr:adenylate kinase [Oscillospiraceae bacterium]